MRPVITSFSVALVLGLASAQLEGVDLGNIDLENVDLDNIDLENLPDNIDPNNLPDDVQDALPSGVSVEDLPSEIPSEVADQVPSDVASGTSAPTASSSADLDQDSLAGLVDQLPRCALTCLSSAADDLGCSETDFECLCDNAQSLATSIGPCVALSSSCEQGDVGTASEVAPEICRRINDNPSESEIASASQVVVDALETSSSGSSDSDDDSSAAGAITAGTGLFGSLMMMVLAF